jgi:hypothetical protein
MQLPQVDLLDPEAGETREHALAQVFRPAEGRPDIRTMARESAPSWRPAGHHTGRALP